MRFEILSLAAMVAALLVLAPLSASANCGTPKDVTGSTETYIDLASDVVTTIIFNPDVSGTETVAAVELEVCIDATNTASNVCVNYDWDSDGDGIVDTNILDGSSTLKTGVVIFANFPYLRIATSTAPSGTDEPQFVVCSRRTK